MSEHQPAFRKCTPAVRRGIQYAIAQLAFDIEHSAPNTIDGVPVTTGVDLGDLSAARDYLRYLMQSKEAA